ncbi:MAG: hypothetical protein WA771_09045 [Chthoniobacterales bacterium]
MKFVPALTLSLLLAALLPTPTLRAELPPSAYEEMQRDAPEVLRLNILTVTRTPSSDAESIDLLAEVIKVGRTENNLAVGDMITVHYELKNHPAGWVGPGPVSVPEETEETVAYLKLSDNGTDYAPAAGMMTFRLF